MNSRMERYYKNKNTNLRSQRNRDLYSDIYSNSKYTNIEGIASIDNANEIDITKIKEMLKNRENYQKERQYRKITGQPEVPEKNVIKRRIVPDTEERNYDIRDILNKAKENKQPDDKERVLSKTSYDVLKNIELKRNVNRKDYYDEDLDDMIKTISNTNMLNKMDDASLAADMFSDLQANDEDTKVGNLNNIKDLIEENKKQSGYDKKEQTMDNSFFTSNLKLKKKDFVNYDEDEVKKGSVFKTIFVTILILGIIAVIGILVVQKLGLF